ncbi:regulator of ime2 [Onygenales sp. PD_10]|nr:regulator of ime2 [Onygenales sp. PD_10]
MLLRPATPLSVLLLAAFTLLLLSVLSAPVIKSIPIARVDDINFGIFGYCKGNDCTGIEVGYSPDGITPSEGEDFDLPGSIRHSLSALLIVHPVAAFLTLVCFGLAFAAHFHSPSHSPRYLLGLLILLLPTLLVSLLAFLVDILLFVPHLLWGGWIVLAATILITASGVLTCAMRRTLVSRKARKRRIAENAEMSGENFYNRQNAIKLDAPSTVTADQKGITLNTTPTADSLPAFATFEANSRTPDDDRRPLNSRTPPSVSPDGASNFHPMDDRRDQFGRSGPAGPEGRPRNSPVDEYGNPLPPGAAFGPNGMRGPRSDPRLRNQYSDSSMGSRRGRGPGYGPPRGRGGPPMRGRGGPYGGPRGPPPQGYGMGARGGPMRPGMNGRGRGPPPGYPPQGNVDGYGPYGTRIPNPATHGNPSPRDDYGYDGPRGPSPRNGNAMNDPSPVPPIGTDASRDIEMQLAAGGALAPLPGRERSFSEDDSEVQGMVGLQQNRQADSRDLQSPSSVYSEQVFVPARAEWEGPLQEPTLPVIERQSPSPNLRGPGIGSQNETRSPLDKANTQDSYFEDIDPRFVGTGDMPSALTPGPPGELHPRTSFDDLPEGARSPATSENSHFTSVSQRGVNPKWRPPEAEIRRAKQERQDVLLGSNPDFELPSGRGRGGPGRARIPPAMPPMPPMPVLPGLNNTGNDGGGRYPGAP